MFVLYQVLYCLYCTVHSTVLYRLWHVRSKLSVTTTTTTVLTEHLNHVRARAFLKDSSSTF